MRCYCVVGTLAIGFPIVLLYFILDFIHFKKISNLSGQSKCKIMLIWVYQKIEQIKIIEQIKSNLKYIFIAFDR